MKNKNSIKPFGTNNEQRKKNFILKIILVKKNEKNKIKRNLFLKMISFKNNEKDKI